MKTAARSSVWHIAQHLGIALICGVLVGMLGAFVFGNDPAVTVIETSTSSAPLTSSTSSGDVPEEPAIEGAPEDELPIVVPADEPDPKPVVAPTVGDSISIEECSALLAANPFYADPVRQVARIERDYRTSRPSDAALLRHIACYPAAVWLSGRSIAETKATVDRVLSEAAQSGKIVVFATYNNPSHDSAHWFSLPEGGDYRLWVEAVSETIGNRRAWVILEADALPMSAAYSLDERQRRIADIRSAVLAFKAHAPNTRVYIDIGHNKWLSVAEAATLLTQAGVADAYGFSLNVSNYQKTADVRAYGEAISARVSGKEFIIDTARNGNGPSPDDEWCNAPGRALGTPSQMVTDGSHLSAMMWVKPPGESDGTCNGGPTPGVFWLQYALGLVNKGM